MNIWGWLDSRIMKLHWYDISLIKLSVGAFSLLIAKLWPPILSLEWRWYLILMIIFMLRPVYAFYFKK